MNPVSFTRLFDPRQLLADRVALGIVVALVILLVAVPLAIFVLARIGKVDDKLRRDLFSRYYGWLILIPILVVPIALGAFETIIGIGLLSLFCYREYAQATKLAERALDHGPFSRGHHAGNAGRARSLVRPVHGLGVARHGGDCRLRRVARSPAGYIRRTALAVFGFLLFASASAI